MHYMTKGTVETPGPQTLTQDSYLGPGAWTPATCEFSDPDSIIWAFLGLLSLRKGKAVSKWEPWLEVWMM